ncbi:BrnA antitoxin family protein [Lichenifustis flavocetrariae]|uniref:BrnA antitoxin family protein n=1 Tax=Lichenifustis flavocetrariae TaxID=2949735 RepID=A0AA41Z1L1_9HYPH|nr:BrnA antitoxin family protein [Lichenifustis flavocetrariae]MCW6511317.1 BrnA antitoxin family protein [Lichenifustis flavocetrariae]
MTDTRRASLASIREMKDRDELFHDPAAPTGVEELGPEFWAKARLEPARSSKAVHLKLDPDVFEFFKRQGKGHLTRMQDILKAYVKAHTHS